jgi:NAD(P)H-hydrate repair Nnr-like enzyme with NAD(P)H-hydrate dehydratase domain
MGLGRDEWAEQIYQQWFNLLNQNSHLEVVLDADGLWFLAKHPQKLNPHVYATHIQVKQQLYWVVRCGY